MVYNRLLYKFYEHFRKKKKQHSLLKKKGGNNLVC